MKNLSYQHFMKVIHIKLWVTFLCIFIKTVDKSTFMYYNINKLRDNIYTERLKGD